MLFRSGGGNQGPSAPGWGRQHHSQRDPPFVPSKKLWEILKEMGIPDQMTCLLRNLYAGQEATVITGHGTRDWFQIEKGVHTTTTKSLQSCPTLCDPIDGSPPGSPIPGILQARTLEWVAIPFSRRSSRPRDQTRVSRIAGRFFTI